MPRTLAGYHTMLEASLLATDFLVYSPHKTGTQTISHTLRMNGFGAGN